MNQRDTGHHGGHGSGHGDAHGGGHPPSSVGPRWTRRILTGFFVLCAVVVIADFLYHRHMEHPWEHVPAFYALYGLLGVGGLIMAAKGLRRIVMRPEDYYDAD
jgi:hypothetical protein